MNAFFIVMKLMLQIFIAIWNGFVGIINLIIGRANKKTIENNNRISRGVIENKGVPINSLFINGCNRNSIISGSELFVRNQILINALLNSANCGLPVILMHESNSEIEHMIASQMSNSIIIDRHGLIFDPFYNRSESDIIKMILTVAKKEYGIKDEARYAIKGMLSFLNAKKRKPTLAALANCPYNDLYDKIDNMVYKGKMSDTVGNDIKSYLSSGQGEYIKLKSFFDDLLDECGNNPSKNSLVDVLKAVSEGKTVLVDIGNSTNKHYISALVYQLEIALRMGYAFSLVLDGISISKDIESLNKFIVSNNTNCNLTISTSDLYSMLGGDEKLMYTLLGNSVENIIMQHGSAVSAEEWSKAIGFYEKTETTTTISKGKTKGGFSLFPSYNDNKSLAYSVKREAIIKSEEIIRMSNNEMYIYDRTKNELIHCYITN